MSLYAPIPVLLSSYRTIAFSFASNNLFRGLRIFDKTEDSLNVRSLKRLRIANQSVVRIFGEYPANQKWIRCPSKIQASSSSHPTFAVDSNSSIYDFVPQTIPFNRPQLLGTEVDAPFYVPHFFALGRHPAKCQCSQQFSADVRYSTQAHSHINSQDVMPRNHSRHIPSSQCLHCLLQ